MSVFDKSGSMLCQLQAPIYGFTNNKSLSCVYDCPLFAAEATLSHIATFYFMSVGAPEACLQIKFEYRVCAGTSDVSLFIFISRLSLQKSAQPVREPCFSGPY